MATSKDARGFEVTETAGTWGKMVDGESWLSYDSRLRNTGAGDLGFCRDARSARVSMFGVEDGLWTMVAATDGLRMGEESGCWLGLMRYGGMLDESIDWVVDCNNGEEVFPGLRGPECVRRT